MPKPEDIYDFESDFDPEVDAEPVPTVAPDKKTAARLAAGVPPGSKPTAEPTGLDLSHDAAKRGKDAPQHTPLSVSFAKDFGFTDAEIAELNPKELDTAVRLAHKQMLRTSQEFRRNEPAAPAPSETKVEPEAEKDPLDDLGEFDEKLVGAIKKSRERDRAEIDNLRKELDDSKANQEAAARESVYDAVDAEFAKMPKAVKALIGEGGRKAIANGSFEHSNRVSILKAAEADTSDVPFEQKMHKAAGAIATKLRAALGVTEDEPDLGDEYEAAPAKPAPAKGADGRFAKLPKEDREAAWKEAPVAKPTSRESPLPKGDKKAMATVRQFMLSSGMLNEDDMPDGSFPK